MANRLITALRQVLAHVRGEPVPGMKVRQVWVCTACEHTKEDIWEGGCPRTPQCATCPLELREVP